MPEEMQSAAGEAHEGAVVSLSDLSPAQLLAYHRRARWLPRIRKSAPSSS